MKIQNENANYETSLLDSSLIVTTNKESYNTKVIQCGDYIQTYYRLNTKFRTNKNLEKIQNDIRKVDTDKLIKKDKAQEENNIIESKNITRTKIACQRLAKCNMQSWQTFITLTISDETVRKYSITNVQSAYNRFKDFRDKIKRVDKDFKYIAVPEFHKNRDVLHFHLLTNIEINDTRFIYSQDDNPKFKHIKYWNDGFNNVQEVKGDVKKIIGYISKYMTKNIDNRLFNKHRYYYSTNLSKPVIDYLDLNDTKDLEYLNKILDSKEKIYENNYLSTYDNSAILFQEYL